MGVNNEYNSHIVFDGKTKRYTIFYKLRSQATLSFSCLFVVLFSTTYTTQVTHPLYESSELKTLTILIHKVTQSPFKSIIGIMDQCKNMIIILVLSFILFYVSNFFFLNNYFRIKLIKVWLTIGIRVNQFWIIKHIFLFFDYCLILWTTKIYMMWCIWMM